MAGWRMGMLASNTNFVKWVLRAKSNIDSGQFKPMQQAVIAALNNSSEWHADINKQYAERRVWAEKIIDVLGCQYDKTQVGLFVWAKLPDSASDSKTFIDNILHNAYVFITPGAIFGSNGDRYIRFSLCASVEKLEEAYARCASFKVKSLRQ